MPCWHSPFIETVDTSILRAHECTRPQLGIILYPLRAAYGSFRPETPHLSPVGGVEGIGTAITLSGKYPCLTIAHVAERDTVDAAAGLKLPLFFPPHTPVSAKL